MTDRAGIGVIQPKARADDPAKGIGRAHLSAAFTAQRISEIVDARWEEFDFDGATRVIPRERIRFLVN